MEKSLKRFGNHFSHECVSIQLFRLVNEWKCVTFNIYRFTGTGRISTGYR